MLNKIDYNSFSDKFSDYLNTICHLNMRLFICVGILQVSADSLCKQFGPKTSGLILAHKLFDTNVISETYF